jgi:hypothetical protein
VRLERVGARWFAARGPELAILWHPWRLIGEPVPLSAVATERPRRFLAELPGEGGDEWVSFAVELPKPTQDRARELRIDERPVRLFLTGDLGRRGVFLSDRVALGKRLAPAGKRLAPGSGRTIELVFVGDPVPESSPALSLLRWERPVSSPEPID